MISVTNFTVASHGTNGQDYTFDDIVKTLMRQSLRLARISERASKSDQSRAH